LFTFLAVSAILAMNLNGSKKSLQDQPTYAGTPESAKLILIGTGLVIVSRSLLKKKTRLPPPPERPTAWTDMR
jgi:hypothetical protein